MCIYMFWVFKIRVLVFLSAHNVHVCYSCEIRFNLNYTPSYLEMLGYSSSSPYWLLLKCYNNKYYMSAHVLLNLWNTWVDPKMGPSPNDKKFWRFFLIQGKLKFYRLVGEVVLLHVLIREFPMETYSNFDFSGVQTLYSSLWICPWNRSMNRDEIWGLAEIFF